VNQIDITLPTGTQTGDAVPVQIVGGIATTNTTTIAVRAAHPKGIYRQLP
jgi:hypothetical protein